jgi:hypothetical protein
VVEDDGMAVANEYLTRSPLVLLIGMTLDQQTLVPGRIGR